MQPIPDACRVRRYGTSPDKRASRSSIRDRSHSIALASRKYFSCENRSAVIDITTALSNQHNKIGCSIEEACRFSGEANTGSGGRPVASECVSPSPISTSIYWLEQIFTSTRDSPHIEAKSSGICIGSAPILQFILRLEISCSCFPLHEPRRLYLVKDKA